MSTDCRRCGGSNVGADGYCDECRETVALVAHDFAVMTRGMDMRRAVYGFEPGPLEGTGPFLGVLDEEVDLGISLGHHFTPDLEYDSTGDWITCEHCGCLPDEPEARRRCEEAP
jgi:hypothetical protein